MMTAGTILATWLALMIALALWLALRLKLIRRGGGDYGAELHRFYDESIAAGMSFGEGTDALLLRKEFARLRRVASARVLASPKDWITILDEEKKAGIDRLRPRRDLARRFAETATSLPYTHILYAEAARAAEATISDLPPFDPDSDDWAALNVVKPS